MPYTQTLTGLTEREAVADALYRGLLAFDDNDVSLLRSAFATEDPVFILGDHTIQGFDEIKTQLLDKVGTLDTQHFSSNIRIDMKTGATTAHLTAYGRNQHCPPAKGADLDAPKFTTGCAYDCDLVKDQSDGLWKIKEWRMKIQWLQGDQAVMTMATKE